MRIIDGGVCAPQGFQASGFNGNIKGKGLDRKDCALVTSQVKASIAGMEIGLE